MSATVCRRTATPGEPTILRDPGRGDEPELDDHVLHAQLGGVRERLPPMFRRQRQPSLTQIGLGQVVESKGQDDVVPGCDGRVR